MPENTFSLKESIKDRFKFFFEVLIIFMGIFLFMLVPFFIGGAFESNLTLYGPIYYSTKAIAIFFAIPVFLYLSNILLESQKKQVIIKEDISLAKKHLSLYKIKKSNVKYQILYVILFLFLVFIPLDFFSYIFFPQTIEYQADALTATITNDYLAQNYIVFIVSVIIIQISVGFYEESIARGYVTMRGSVYTHKLSAALIASFFFGLGHFAYFLNPISSLYPIWIPFFWFLQTFFVGIMLSLFVLRKKWLFPVIFAHALNNIISAHAIWNYLQGNDFSNLAIYLYLPLLIVSALLFVIQFKRIKEGIKTGLSDLKTYGSEATNKLEFLVILVVDLIIGLMIFAMGIIIL